MTSESQSLPPINLKSMSSAAISLIEADALVRGHNNFHKPEQTAELEEKCKALLAAILANCFGDISMKETMCIKFYDSKKGTAGAGGLQK